MKSLPGHFLVNQNSQLFMKLCQISWILASFHGRDHIGNHIWRISWRISSKNIVKWWNFCVNSLLNLTELMGAVRRRAVSERARPFRRCCSRATCLTVSLSILQSYNANTCHLGLITHSVPAASAPTVSSTDSKLAWSSIQFVEHVEKNFVPILWSEA